VLSGSFSRLWRLFITGKELPFKGDYELWDLLIELIHLFIKISVSIILLISVLVDHDYLFFYVFASKITLRTWILFITWLRFLHLRNDWFPHILETCCWMNINNVHGYNLIAVHAHYFLIFQGNHRFFLAETFARLPLIRSLTVNLCKSTIFVLEIIIKSTKSIIKTGGSFIRIRNIATFIRVIRNTLLLHGYHIRSKTRKLLFQSSSWNRINTLNNSHWWRRCWVLIPVIFFLHGIIVRFLSVHRLWKRVLPIDYWFFKSNSLSIVLK